MHMWKCVVSMCICVCMFICQILHLVFSMSIGPWTLSLSSKVDVSHGFYEQQDILSMDVSISYLIGL